MIKLLKQYKKILIILSFPYVYLLMVLVMPTQMAVTAPGGLTRVVDSIQLENVEFVDNFNTVYVYSYNPITPFQSFVLSNDKTMNVYEMTARQRDTSWKDDYTAGQIQKLVSLKTSIIKAYDLAHDQDNRISIDYYYAGLYLTYRPSRLTDLKVGDKIVAINGINYSGHTHESFLALAYQNEVTFTILRTEEDLGVYHTVTYQYDEDDSRMIFYPNYEIESASPNFTLPGLDGLVGGPSGGMIQTLSIYASLLKLNIGDLKIAGTGTIEMSGKIGRVGGVPQKMYTALYQNIDVFIVPEAHIDDIPGVIFPYELVIVDTIEEAVQWLNEYND
jgi:Lon-like protease